MTDEELSYGLGRFQLQSMDDALKLFPITDEEWYKYIEHLENTMYPDGADLIEDSIIAKSVSGCCWNPDPPVTEDYAEWLNDPKYTSHIFSKEYLSRSSRSVELVMSNMQVDGWQCKHDVSTGNLYCRKKL